MGSSDEESDEITIQLTKKKTKVEKPVAGKKKLSKSMKPASPPKAKKNSNAIKYDEDSDGIIMDYDDLPKGPPRSRVARGAAKKYVEVLSSDEEEEGSIMLVDE
jgi:DNA topoisomerase II